MLYTLFATAAFANPIPSAVVALVPRETKYPYIKTLLSSKYDFVNVGSVDPVEDIVGALSDNCNDFECNVDFTVSSRYASIGGTSRDVKVAAIGSWVTTADDKNPRDWLIDALKKVVSANIQTHRETGPPAGRNGAVVVIEHNMQINSGISRSVTQEAGFEPVQQGDLSITISLDSAGAGACDKVMGAVGAVAGAISGFAAAFFGVVGAATCPASD